MPPLATVGLLAAGVWLVLWVFFPLARGALYEPSSPDAVRRIVDAAEVVAGERAADLGSGDGRILIALAERGAEAHGWEVNPILVLLSRRRIRAAGLADRAHVHLGSFWRADLSSFQVVTSFQVGFIMSRLEDKLRSEMAAGSRIISHYWRFPTLSLEWAQGDVYRYRR